MSQVREIEAGCRGMSQSKPPEPCAIVIFGASGDLTRRDLMPALFQLACRGLQPEKYVVVGFARKEWTDDSFREQMAKAIKEFSVFRPPLWEDFAKRLYYVPGDFRAPADQNYAALKRKLEELSSRLDLPANYLFHFATPPEFYDVIVQRMAEAGLTAKDKGYRRVIVEKPFGHDRESACRLNRRMLEVLEEDQIYRIDHFLGKETVQNMLAFRFANPSFEPIWNRNYIDHVQISVAESIGVEGRAAFYEPTGVIRDMIQNHLLQLLCMAAMEPPVAFDGVSFRNETLNALRAVRCVNIEADAVAGQYGAGRINGTEVPGYRQEPGVAEGSVTPTYAAMKLVLENWRWAGVPFYLRTGKRMSEKRWEIIIQFKPTPHLMFPLEDRWPKQSNVLTFRLQPDEGIIHRFIAKQPGPDIVLQPVTMSFLYASAFGIEEPPNAYEWLLLDAMQGEQTLFARADWIERAWEIVDPIIRRWEGRSPEDFPNYPAGSSGPPEGDELMAREGRKWQR
jgi:glucose-6-phosphate 1-dehydrogenase